MQRQVSSALEQVRGSAAEASRRGSGRENEEDDNVIEHLVVPLRPRTSVTWSPDTVDNEDAGKRSSKRCCIYHAPRVFGEWSDTEDSGAWPKRRWGCGRPCTPDARRTVSHPLRLQTRRGTSIPEAAAR